MKRHCTDLLLAAICLIGPCCGDHVGYLDLLNLNMGYEDVRMSPQELAFFLATHGFDARPDDGYVTVKIDNLVYKMTPNKERPGLADIAAID